MIAHCIAASASLRRPRDFDELRALVEVGELLGQQRTELDDPFEIREVTDSSRREDYQITGAVYAA